MANHDTFHFSFLPYVVNIDGRDFTVERFRLLHQLKIALIHRLQIGYIPLTIAVTLNSTSSPRGIVVNLYAFKRLTCKKAIT